MVNFLNSHKLEIGFAQLIYQMQLYTERFRFILNWREFFRFTFYKKTGNFFALDNLNFFSQIRFTFFLFKKNLDSSLIQF